MILQTAFCKNCYDVTNSAITPKNPKAGVWGFDGNAKMKCLRKNVSTKAIESCAHFQCKL